MSMTWIMDFQQESTLYVPSIPDQLFKNDKWEFSRCQLDILNVIWEVSAAKVSHFFTLFCQIFALYIRRGHFWNQHVMQSVKEMRQSKIILLSLLPRPTPLYAAELVIAESGFQCGSKCVIPVTRTINSLLFRSLIPSTISKLDQNFNPLSHVLRAHRIKTKDSSCQQGLLIHSETECRKRTRCWL